MLRATYASPVGARAVSMSGRIRVWSSRTLSRAGSKPKASTSWATTPCISTGPTGTTQGFILTISFGRFAGAMSVSPSASSQYNGMANGKWEMANGRGWIVCLLTFAICHLPCPSECRTNTTIQAFNEGVKYFNAKQFDQAIPRFNEAISGDPEFVEALFARGACRYYLKSMDGALFDLNDTLLLKPDYWAARALRGAVNYESDRWDDALADFNAVLKENPHDAQSLLG